MIIMNHYLLTTIIRHYPLKCTNQVPFSTGAQPPMLAESHAVPTNVVARAPPGGTHGDAEPAGLGESAASSVVDYR